MDKDWRPGGGSSKKNRRLRERKYLKQAQERIKGMSPMEVKGFKAALLLGGVPEELPKMPVTLRERFKDNVEGLWEAFKEGN